MIAAVACAAFMISCASVQDKAESYAEDYVEAYKSEQFEKANEILKEAEEYSKGLSEEDQKIFSELLLTTSLKLMYGAE